MPETVRSYLPQGRRILTSTRVGTNMPRYALRLRQPPKPTKTYNPRHPQRTLLYKTVAEHFETWLELASAGQFDGQDDHHTPPPYVEKAFRKYLECGIFAYGFARVRCDDCGDNYLVAYSCKGRAICPSCNTRRMAEAAAHLHLGAVAFIHRFGSSLNTHVHFHVCVVDGVFEALSDAESNTESITFHPAQIDEAAIAEVQANVRKRLLRYCARPPFDMDRLKQRGADLVYRCGKGHTEPLQSDKYSGELVLTPLELIDRIAQLVPPSRPHRHRYYGVLAPNSPLRGVVTAMAQMPLPVPVPPAQVVQYSPMVVPPGTAAPNEPRPKSKPRPSATYLWAALIARIYEVFPLICPNCGGQMRIIAFITFSADILKILDHIGVEPEAPRITPARGPPLWDDCGAQETGEGVEAEPDWDLANQSPPDYPDDQRTTW